MVELAALTWMAEAFKKILCVWVLDVDAGLYAPFVEPENARFKSGALLPHAFHKLQRTSRKRSGR
jgi:hypothetical protein